MQLNGPIKEIRAQTLVWWLLFEIFCLFADLIHNYELPRKAKKENVLKKKKKTIAIYAY